MNNQKDNSTLVSLFTDASYNHSTRRGGWGAWARGATGRVYNGGCWHREIENQAAEAELIAIIEGLKMCIRAGVVKPGFAVLVQTDNMRAAHMMPIWSPSKNTPWQQSKRNRIPQPVNQYERDAMYTLRQIETDYGLRIMGRWIKGHNYKKSQSKRSWINELTDKLASWGRKRADYKYYNDNIIVDTLLYKPDRTDMKKASQLLIPSTESDSKDDQIEAAYKAREEQKQTDAFQPDMFVVDFTKVKDSKYIPKDQNNTDYPKDGRKFVVNGNTYKWVNYKPGAQKQYGKGRFQIFKEHNDSGFFKWSNENPPKNKPWHYINMPTKLKPEIEEATIKVNSVKIMVDENQSHPDYVPWKE